LSSLRLKVKVIRTPVYDSALFVYDSAFFVGEWILRTLKKPEDAGRRDEFAMHLSVGCPCRRSSRNQIDVLLILEMDIPPDLA